jgi:hypothetical protein
MRSGYEMSRKRHTELGPLHGRTSCPGTLENAMLGSLRQTHPAGNFVSALRTLAVHLFNARGKVALLVVAC